MQRTKRCQSSKKLNKLNDFVPLACYYFLVFLRARRRQLERGVHWRGVSNTNFTLYVLEEAFVARGSVLEGASIRSVTVLRMESHQPWGEE